MPVLAAYSPTADTSADQVTEDHAAIAVCERPEFSRLPRASQLLVLQWLDRDCGALEKVLLEDDLRRAGSALEPAFLEALRSTDSQPLQGAASEALRRLRGG